MKVSIAIIVTCMGRALHLRQTLLYMLSQKYDNYKVVIVDWSSKDDLQDVLKTFENERLLSTYVPNKRFFSLSGARNAGGDFLLENGYQFDYLAFLDADVVIPPDFLENNVGDLSNESNIYLQRNKTELGDLGIWGSCIVPAEAWKRVRYNEKIDTYGEEDNEFYRYLDFLGYERKPLKTRGIVMIQHSDELRMENYTQSVEDIPELKRANKKKFRIPE